MFGYSKEAVRVKVKKCEGKLQPELRKFSVDPQITSLEVLQSILVKAFDVKSDFTLSYRTVDDYGQEVYLPLLSDWDLDAAFLKAHNIALTQRSEPCVQLKVDMKPFAEASEDWEPPTISSAPVTQNCKEQPTVYQAAQVEKQESQTGFQGLIMNQVEKTFNMVSRALNLYDDPNTPPRPPLSDNEFRAFLDAVGQINNTTKLREVIYCGGIEPSLRKVVWKHILNVYPDGMTGKERMDYIKRKANEYYALRTQWKDCIQKGKVDADLAYVTSMVRKDVLRTDRHHNFYAGSDDNQNIASLFNILTTYAIYHPTVSYCQGMSDLASPLLVTMGDEAHAYICLCALMTRLYPNFLLDGEAMTLKFTHLTESLQVYDPDFYNYLKSQQADDLLFCYRWLLLEMKREFAFDDALRMLEVLWASLPQKAPAVELPLKERDFDSTVEINIDPPPLSPLVKAPRENAYTKVCAIRRQSSSFSLANVKAPKLATTKQTNHSLDENAARKILNNSSLKHAKEYQSLDDAVLQSQKISKDSSNDKIDDRDSDEQKVGKDINKIPKKREMKSVPEHVKDLEAQDSSTIAWASTGNLSNGTSHTELKEKPLGSQIRLLRDKISVHNNRFFSSLDTLDDSNSDNTNKPKVKMIKNLNEFLNFATGSRPVKQEKLQRTHSAIERTRTKENPKITLTKTSYEENDATSQSLRTQINKISKMSFDTNDGSSPDDSQEYYPMTTSMTRELRLELEHLDRQVFGPSYVNRCSMICDSPSDSTSAEEKPAELATETKVNCVVTDALEVQTEVAESIDFMKKSPLLDTIRSNARSAEDIYLWENPLHRNTPTTRTTASCPQTPDEQAELDFDGDTGEIFEEHSGKKSITPIRLLRKNHSLEPQDLGKQNSNAHSSESDSSEKDPPESVNAITIKNNQQEGVNLKSHKFFSNMSHELENAKKNCESLLNVKQSNLQSVASTINNFQKKYEVFKPPTNKITGVPSTGTDNTVKNSISSLPSPSIFGGGNPFLMYLCLTVLLQHRDYIMRNRMDYNELAMHFDKMVRKHNVNRVLNQARQMYALYLKQQAHKTGDVTI
ncbi:TBC1 domain family member 25 isoform X1 [Vanessa cardui]|uniref:TBC1 domain family member 25 isoform X1 n=2 Tax=Vanessa cardui TaxID=171605 RepID=UPI001F1298C8|nr:TBC1 domain family member 25 isoform X1 [Vanessa cardui]